MILKKLTILNYKNILQSEIEPSPGVNCFLGNNGMGKTNLLDAIYFLSFCRSFTSAIDSQQINHESEFFMLQGSYQHQEEVEEIHCGMKRKQKKHFKRNKKEYQKLSEHIGLIPLVMISPDDIDLITGYSEGRRKFMDMVISQYDRLYLETLINYNNALQQRNALLKEEAEIDPLLFQIWEERMSQYGAVIYEKRAAFVTDFLPVFQQYYSFISNNNEQVGIRYISHCSQGELLPLLTEVRERDKGLGYSSRGVHKDELEMTLGDYLMKQTGSQGQNKTLLISLKLAQFDFLKKQGDKTPILLLDDIFDKLDSLRVEQIIKLVSGEQFGQIFITDTNREHLDEIIQHLGVNYHLYAVDKGEITLREGSEI